MTVVLSTSSTSVFPATSQQNVYSTNITTFRGAPQDRNSLLDDESEDRKNTGHFEGLAAGDARDQLRLGVTSWPSNHFPRPAFFPSPALPSESPSLNDGLMDVV